MSSAIFLQWRLPTNSFHSVLVAIREKIYTIVLDESHMFDPKIRANQAGASALRLHPLRLAIPTNISEFRVTNIQKVHLRV